MSIDRFLAAQANPHAGFTTALRELRAGEKEGHWIWYVFPQLAGMGRSDVAIRFALEDASEACDYLADPTLRARLSEAVATVRRQVLPPHDIPLHTLMGGGIDAMKLVSSLTLFAHVAKNNVDCSEMRAGAEAVLAASAGQGYPQCAFTLGALGAEKRRYRQARPTAARSNGRAMRAGPLSACCGLRGRLGLAAAAMTGRSKQGRRQGRGRICALPKAFSLRSSRFRPTSGLHGDPKRGSASQSAFQPTPGIPEPVGGGLAPTRYSARRLMGLSTPSPVWTASSDSPNP